MSEPTTQSEMFMPKAIENHPHWEVVKNSDKRAMYIITRKSNYSDTLFTNRYYSACDAIGYICREVSEHNEVSALAITKVVMDKQFPHHPDVFLSHSFTELQNEAYVEMQIAREIIIPSKPVDKE